MFDPIFDLLAGLLAWFYSLYASYGFAIIALTTVVLIVFAPLTYKSTKSMVAMRRIQPHVRRIQKKHSGDRERMNQEMMALYQEHNVSPMSGCLPILIQMPVFIVMFRVLRGITRRSSEIGLDVGNVVTSFASEKANPTVASSERRNFNPEYVNTDSELYRALVGDNEMLWLGVDLSRTPIEALRDSLSEAFPYLLMVALVAALGVYQQRQIAGRAGGEISQQQQLIMRIIPWMLPIFSFTMPGGLVLYFIVSALLRIIQQAYITRTVYGDEELTTPLELPEDPDGFVDDDSEPDNPLASLFGKRDEVPAAAGSRHGSRRPTSGSGGSRSRSSASRPPRDTPVETGGAKRAQSKAAKTETTAKKTAKNAAEEPRGWGRAKRSAPAATEPAKPASRRVTPKGGSGRKRK